VGHVVANRPQKPGTGIEAAEGIFEGPKNQPGPGRDAPVGEGIESPGSRPSGAVVERSCWAKVRIARHPRALSTGRVAIGSPTAHLVTAVEIDGLATRRRAHGLRKKLTRGGLRPGKIRPSLPPFNRSGGATPEHPPVAASLGLVRAESAQESNVTSPAGLQGRKGL